MVAEAVRMTRGCPFSLAAALALAAAGACQSCNAAPEGRSAAGPASHPGPAAVPPAPRPTGPVGLTGVVRVVIDLPGVTGLSDLATDDTGRAWALAEHTRVLVRMEADGSAPRAIPLEGVPAGLDTEGLAWIEGDRLALATESDSPGRVSDLVLFARVVAGGERIAVERSLPLDYGLWHLRANANQGIEGLCHAGPALVAAVESVVERGGERFAPVAVLDLASRGWTPYLVRLTTATGKISALACQIRGGVIDVLAVERHFDVARLIRFELLARRQVAGAPTWPAEVAPVLAAELTPLLERQENFEGLLWDGDRAIALVVDNDWVGVSGPNLFVRARLSGPAPEPPEPPRPVASPRGRSGR